MLTGLDILATGPHSGLRRRLRGCRVGLLTHSAATDGRGFQTRIALEELGIHPRILFGPEHGIEGTAQAQVAVGNQNHDPESFAAATVSLYGDSKESLSPTKEQIEGLDVLVIDLVDVGSRYYTYVWTALLAARAAAEAGVSTLVLDRPNPISGDPRVIEGAPQSDNYLSFVGLAPLPIRHSMTIGEVLVDCFSKEGREVGPTGQLSVLPARGWERQRTAHAWARPFAPPSPNMPTTETALVYPGGCLLEGTNLSEGRGTTLPFQTVGAPFLDSEKFVKAVHDRALPGVQIRTHHFIPSFDKFAGELCNGALLQVTNPRTFRPVATYLTLVSVAAQQSGGQFKFSTEPYEFETDRPAFDLLTGSDVARKAIEEGKNIAEIIEQVCPVDDEWRARVAEVEALALASQPAG